MDGGNTEHPLSLVKLAEKVRIICSCREICGTASLKTYWKTTITEIIVLMEVPDKVSLANEEKNGEDLWTSSQDRIRAAREVSVGPQSAQDLSYPI